MKPNEKKALDYHEYPKPGKLSVESSKACETAEELSLAYTPGVAVPVKEIAKDAKNAYRYTNKGNLVAVITDGTAVLGLGNVGALAGKPVMEGKGVLFKRFAGIDVFDIEVNCKDPDEFIQTVENIAPTFGGINLEDIAAPNCFYIEQELKKRLDIPVFHDDQHGTAIISSAALLNALELAGKKISEVNIVVNGAGASAMACIKLYVSLGAKKENIVMVDSKGAIRKDRGELNKYKPLEALSKFVELEELKEIKFKRLQNSILVKEGVIIIPKFEILSSAMNLSIAGTHTFNNDIDYHLSLIHISEPTRPY